MLRALRQKGAWVACSSPGRFQSRLQWRQNGGGLAAAAASVGPAGFQHQLLPRGPGAVSLQGPNISFLTSGDSCRNSLPGGPGYICPQMDPKRQAEVLGNPGETGKRISAPNTKCFPLLVDTQSTQPTSHTHTVSTNDPSTGTFPVSLRLVTISESVMAPNCTSPPPKPVPQG